MKVVPLAALIGVSLGATVCPASGQSQDNEWRYRVEAFGEVAHGRFYHGDDRLGSGGEFGGGAGVRPFQGRLRGLGFEVRGTRLSDERGDIATSHHEMTASMVAANAVYHFRGRSHAQPFVYGGLGVTRLSYSGNCNACVFSGSPETGLTPIPQRWDTRDTKAGLTFGLGLKVAITQHLSVRPEIAFLDTTPGSGGNYGWFRILIGLGVHF